MDMGGMWSDHLRGGRTNEIWFLFWESFVLIRFFDDGDDFFY